LVLLALIDITILVTAPCFVVLAGSAVLYHLGILPRIFSRTQIDNVSRPLSLVYWYRSGSNSSPS
jgi:hypothetical protein